MSGRAMCISNKSEYFVSFFSSKFLNLHHKIVETHRSKWNQYLCMCEKNYEKCYNVKAHRSTIQREKKTVENAQNIK